MNLNYFELFTDLRNWLLAEKPSSTADITSNIKNFFTDKFQDYTVLPNNNCGEYLLDIMVTSFIPLNILDNSSSVISVAGNEINNYIAVESELGGAGGSSAYGVQKNVVEDYIKLLLINSKYKVMIFTSLPFSGEENHIDSRVDNLKEIYLKVCPNEQGVLLIHLPGSQPKSSQVQASIQGITGYVISGNGEHVGKIAT